MFPMHFQVRRSSPPPHALRATSPEPTGNEAASSAPMPAPLPNTNRPPRLIVTNPLLDKALAAAMSSVPPLTVVPPRVGVRAAEDQLPAAADVQRRAAAALADAPGDGQRAAGRGR